MKKIAKFFLYLTFFILALMVFIPKTSVYFFGEQNLKKFGVVISKESLTETLFSLKIENLEVSAKAVDAAHIDALDITLLGVYNSVDVEKIKLSSLVETYLPSKIEHLNITYSIFNPLNVKASAIGEFGEVQAAFNLLDLNASVTLKPSKVMLSKYKRSLKFFKKSTDGEYVYAKAI